MDEWLATNEQIQIDWENHIKKIMVKSGWICDIDNDEKLGFCFEKDGAKQIRDYDKKSHTFVQFDPDHKITLRVTRPCSDSTSNKQSD